MMNQSYTLSLYEESFLEMLEYMLWGDASHLAWGYEYDE
jgi:hypothetical protein